MNEDLIRRTEMKRKTYDEKKKRKKLFVGCEPDRNLEIKRK